jgi:hypothetical protein
LRASDLIQLRVCAACLNHAATKDEAQMTKDEGNPNAQ